MKLFFKINHNLSRAQFAIMDILIKVPLEIQRLIVDKCPLAHRTFLEKLIFDGEITLDEKLKKFQVGFNVDKMTFATKCDMVSSCMETEIEHYRMEIGLEECLHREDSLEVKKMNGECEELEFQLSQHKQFCKIVDFS